MRKCRSRQVLALLLSASLLTACAAREAEEESQTPASSNTETAQEMQETENGQDESQSEISQEQSTPAFFDGQRPQLIADMTVDSVNVTPCVKPYTIAPDLSNVENLWQFYFEDALASKIAENGFAVYESGGHEFFNVYESNRYSFIPNFITVDSLMHTYHLYFAHLLKNIEKGYLTDTLKLLSEKMLLDSIEQYEALKGSEWESAAKRNVAFFGVGTKLLDESAAVPDDVADIVQNELAMIESAEGIQYSGITGDEENYTQYIPRGYYKGDAGLEKYFRAMMWYGRIHFKQEEAEMDRSALLMTLAMKDDGQAYEMWRSVYAVTSFFAGASDDLGVCEYAAALQQAYGDNVTVESLLSDKEAFETFHTLTAKLPAPQINSIPIMQGENNVIPGFRFMGQRFTIDAVIMQNLIYSMVEENSAGDKRMLPDVLDVPAALGSDTALHILEENGETEYEDYMENMNKLREELSGENASLWSASLYAGWLYTLRPLLSVKGEGYPAFMQNEEWVKKDLECFAGSFTELKHDTVLYSKQVIAEMGGGDEDIPDDRGYVEPEPLVYERFVRLAGQTAQGLKEYGMLNAEDEENLLRLSQMAEQLLTISVKELQNEDLTEDEYEFIRSYGGSIEHFWYETFKDEDVPEGEITAQAFPAALVVDIATDPNGTVLEAATGNPSDIYVVVNVAGKIKIARGSVYTFYQFPWQMSDRMTDAKWRQLMGIAPDEEGYYHYDNPFEQPEWTDSYRYHYEWE
ncbi:MAG: DUF3160 domain-containing protein [Bacillus sp. (in: Bacteria)]|nr:DUF3160 domain-containing protein [Bacillus sp. (in: firmicutes)]MCM1425792.1 DUF3160 domain-containing protein [Eubacterium sp.]